MLTWLELDKQFGDLAPNFNARLDYQWGAADIHYRLAAPLTPATQRFEALAQIAGMKLSELPAGALHADIMQRGAAEERWYEALRYYSGLFETDLAGIQHDAGTYNGHIYTGHIQSPIAASSVVALKFSVVSAKPPEVVVPASESQVPLVMISYSHDSPEHKRWVAELADRLMKNGVPTIFDQWDLRLGDDVPKFMERSVREASRVLVICTEAYVTKADGGRGGVGYEAMIVTGELIQDLGTAKFIPIVRQQVSPPKLPAALSTRFYVDLSRDIEFGEQFDRLLRELHRAPLTPKPALGPNPFAADVPAVISTAPAASSRQGPDSMSPSDFYARARMIAAAEDMAAWRSLVGVARSKTQSSLAQWWQQTVAGKEVPRDAKQLIDESFAGLVAFEPMIAVALAGVSTGREKFNNQVALFEEIVMPAGWERGGLVVRIELPHAGGFLYQGLHGALCLHTGQLTTAINLVRENIKLPSWNRQLRIHQVSDFIGWPDSLGGDSTKCWKVLLAMVERWPWLLQVFGTEDDYVRALVAYYTALIVNEYAFDVAAGNEASFAEPGKLRIEVPTHFATATDDVRRAAYRLLTASPCSVCDIWRSLKLVDHRAHQHWGAWLDVYAHAHGQVYPYASNTFADLADLVSYSASRCARA